MPARDLLTDSGPIADALGERFEPRPEQLAMADAVAKAMRTGSTAMIEAGTGVGKSFAYLVPAIAQCIEHGQTVVVATNTIALQEQIINKDLPLLIEALGDRLFGDDGAALLRPVLVKGRGNYLSIRRLKVATERAVDLLGDPEARNSLEVIVNWAYDTEDGSLATAPTLARPGVWDRVASDAHNCMGKRCPHHEACFYQSARREMEAGNLLICNHALFFADLALRADDAGFLPEYQHVILDEAHGIEDTAADHFGITLSQGKVLFLLSSLAHPKTGKGTLRALARLDVDQELLSGAFERVAVAREAAAAFFGSLIELSQRADMATGRIREPGAVSNTLSEAFADLALRLRKLREAVKNENDRFDLASAANRAADIARAATILVDQTLDGACYWLETSTRPGGLMRVTLAASPIDVGPILRKHLFEGDTSVILTSATLATGPRAAGDDGERDRRAFAHAMDRLGCDPATTLLLGSPFHHASQVEVHIDRTCPEPKGGPPDQAYLRELCSRIHDHVVATDGGAFVLFTSFQMLNTVADWLGEALESIGMSVFVQGRGAARSTILEGFRQSDRGVLFGAASFWQGVDVQGAALRNVIITRLPFEPPYRPLTEARLERIKERGGNPFMEDSLPRAILRFKQGFGRLIRSRTDKGRVVILDPRIVTKRYGRLFLEALPEGTKIVEVGMDESASL